MKILCLCTGNTCRSPMLEALLRARLDRDGRTGHRVESAGTGALAGQSASASAQAAMRARGLDLSPHRARAASELALDSFDLVLAMSSAHAAFARAHGVPAGKLAVVNAEGGGVPDPFGGSLADYEACAQVLERAAAQVSAQLAPTAQA